MRISDWSSDVCSSDLACWNRPELLVVAAVDREPGGRLLALLQIPLGIQHPDVELVTGVHRHEQRRSVVIRSLDRAADDPVVLDLRAAGPDGGVDRELRRRALLRRSGDGEKRRRKQDWGAETLEQENSIEIHIERDECR